MSTRKKDVLTVTGKWWKHLRGTKRRFWKGERQAAQREASKETEINRDQRLA
jgi:hypothetical protein